MKTTINLPEKEFTGIGEVRGFEFLRLKESDKGFLYQVTSNGNIHYEIFKAKKSPLCIDFEKKIFSDTHFKYRYPKAKDFGHWAWTKKSIDEAKEMFVKICKD